MNWCKKYALPMALLIVVLASMLAILPLAMAQATPPGPASDKVIARRYAIADVPTVIARGDIDAYMFSLRPAQAEQLRGIPGVTLISAAAGLIELTLNNAPVHIERFPGKLTEAQVIDQLRQKGINVPPKALVNLYYEEEGGTTYTVAEFGAFPGKGVNPFAFKEIRLAMNYVVDRSTFASVVMRGFAVPMYTFLSHYDPDYALIADIVAKYEFEYNPTYAKQAVERTLKEIGAVMEGGVWKYEGKPITLTLIIRPEDERRDLGYMFNTELKLLGFDTAPRELPFAQAIDIIYGSDPKEFRWHVYTAGWGKGGIDKYDSGTIAQYCAPWVGYMPGWQETAFWNYRNDTLDDLTQRIYQGNFKSKQERDELYRTATEMCIQESIRIWVVARLDTWPVRAEVKGVTLDIGAGLRGIWNLREMHREDRKELYVGHLYVWTATSEWNVWGGFNDVYSVDWARVTYDPSAWNHPFNGRPVPFRVQWAIFTAGPDGQLDVPSTAKVWDVSGKQWVSVGTGVKAKSKVVFDLSKFIDAKWHNGMKITMADLVGYIALLYEIAYNPVYSALESRIASNSKQFLDTVKGWEFNDQAKTMTVYVDYWHFDEAYIASWATVTPINPIEIHVASFELALDRRNETNIVFYRRTGYETLSLVVPKHVSLVRDTLLKYKNNAAVLEKVNRFTDGRMTMGEWNSRIDADVSWIGTYGLAWISQGPFMLTKLDTTAQVLELTAFRDPAYPFKKGDWYFGFPVRTEIVSVELSTPVKDKIAIGYDAVITTKLSGLPPFQLKYILRDPAGNIVATGYGEKAAEDTFVVKFTADLTRNFKPDTPYTLILIGVSDQVAEPGVVRRVLVATQYEVTPTTPTTPVTTPTTPTTTPTTPTVTPTTPTTPVTTPAPAPAPSVLPYIIVAVVVVVVLAVVFVLRKK